jgi:hypothetical protein
MSKALVSIWLFVACSGSDDTAQLSADSADPPVTTETQPTDDLDGDGWSEADGDCDDDDESIHPEADEVWYDGIDQDCDGADDYDRDLDGFAGGTEGMDCDDTDATINPDAPEVCDGLDNDCSGKADDGDDLDQDGFDVVCDADCDDSEASVHPTAEEVCDGLDNNCDGTVDGNATDAQAFYLDSDGDTFGDPESEIWACSVPKGHVDQAGDCDDSAADVNPDQTETCDDRDEDCDDGVDEGLDATWYLDSDSDGFGDSDSPLVSCADPGSDYADQGDDCDDSDGSANPDGTEICDDVDQDCDGSVDEGTLSTFYLDFDSDGYGLLSTALDACSEPSGYASVAGDCDDAEATTSPAASEVCDEVDQDCDGSTDEGLATSTWYVDDDGDGYGIDDGSIVTCADPGSDYATQADDCDDDASSVNPSASETCDGTVDEDCDGTVDEGVTTTIYADLDNDGFGDATTAQDACSVPSGYASNGVDCDDGDSTSHPGATEVCDETADNDCDGNIDEGVTTVFYGDADNDGFGDASITTDACSVPSGYAVNALDCDDGDSSSNPGAPEICDETADNDCDGSIDEGVTTTFYADTDADGFGDATDWTEACSLPSDHSTNAADCDDTDSTSYPGATEICDETADNDCDGSVDEAVTTTFYADIDGDGFGDATSTSDACTLPSDHATIAQDCDDSDGAVNPDATEICDETVDNDCDGSIDEGVTLVVYTDADGDGFGDSDSASIACSVDSGYAAIANDCDDSQASIKPTATETCDGIDQDCDGSADEGLPSVTYYTDSDGDGFGDVDASMVSCTDPGSGYATNGEDCDDSQAGISPEASEVCDGVDQDCDGTADNGLPAVTYYTDSDGDGFGDADSSTVACADPGSGYATDGTDCNDADTTVNPDAEEICDGLDQDCDGSADNGLTFVTWYTDSDSDGFGDPATGDSVCTPPGSGYATNSLDCDDDDSSISPSGTEVCDGVDQDCDGSADNGLTFVTWYSDSDGDGFGDASSSTTLCSDPGSGYAESSTDCDDSDSGIHPDAAEICDGLDQDCDGEADGGLVFVTYVTDLDGDGFGVDGTEWDSCIDPGSGYATEAGDCDDNDFSVSPAETEVCNDWIDNDCDGTDNGCALSGVFSLASAEVQLSSPTGSAYMGWRVAAGGDVDGDGLDDFICGSPKEAGGGMGYVISGGSLGALTTSDAYGALAPTAGAGEAGRSVALGDLDGDGYTDMIVGAYTDNSVYIWYGPLASASAVADVVITGSSNFGHSVASGRDLDGDGNDDLVIGASSMATSAGGSPGAAYVFYGPLAGTLTDADADAVLEGDISGEQAGAEVAMGGDLLGDGGATILVSAQYNNANGNRAGAVYIIGGAPLGTSLLSDSDAVIYGANSDDRLWDAHDAGDVDGDGQPDLVVGASGVDGDNADQGGAFVFLGPLWGAMDLSVANVTITATSKSDLLGYSVGTAGDVNGDGFSDIIVGAYGDDTVATNSGAAFLYYGPIGSVLTEDDADVVLTGAAEQDQAGLSVDGGFDMNGDGYDDVLVGAWKDDQGSADGGACYVVFGAGL